MNRWKRLAPVTAVVASAAMVLTGCGGSDDKAADDSKLTVWMMGEGGDAQNAFLEGVETEFRQKHPDTDVVVQYIPGSRRPRSSRPHSLVARGRTSPNWATPRPRAGLLRKRSPT
ncbi:hypothetical protein GCM10027614_31930 [Micromonospora vulcania]